MEILTHLINNEPVAEIISDDLIIIEPKDALDLMGKLIQLEPIKSSYAKTSCLPGFLILRPNLPERFSRSFQTIISSWQ